MTYNLNHSPRARGKVDRTSLEDYVWSKAPAQANYFSMGENGHMNCWLHVEEGKIVTVWTEEGKIYNYLPTDYQPSVPGPHFPRPVKEEALPLPEWDGEGLPPVGSTVQLVDIPANLVCAPFHNWMLGDYLEVIAHKEICGTVLPVVWNVRDQTASSILVRLIRPVTQESLAARKGRQKAIEEMSSLVSSMDLARALEVLYDEGYRKQEATK